MKAPVSELPKDAGTDSSESGSGKMAIGISRVARKVLGITEIDLRTTKPFSIAVISLDRPERLAEERGKKGLDLCMWSLIENLSDAGFLPENIAYLSETNVVAVMPEADWDYTQSRVDRALTRHDGYARTVNSGALWHASAGIASFPRDERRIFELSRWAERALSIARFMGSDASFSWSEGDEPAPGTPLRRAS
jgi:hypothetical protein